MDDAVTTLQGRGRKYKPSLCPKLLQQQTCASDLNVLKSCEHAMAKLLTGKRVFTSLTRYLF